MPRTTTLATLRTRVRQRCEMEQSEFVSDSELNSYISASYADLYDRLVRANPEFYAREQTITGDGSAYVFDVSSDYRSTVCVSYSHSSGLRSRLRRITLAEVDDQDSTTLGISLAYTLRYNATTPSTPQLAFYPKPRSGDEYIHTYIVAPADLTDDADIVDGVSGWEEFIVLDSAIKCLVKEESTAQAQALMGERNRVVERIEQSNTRMFEPGGIGDNSRRFTWDSDLRYLKGL